MKMGQRATYNILTASHMLWTREEYKRFHRTPLKLKTVQIPFII